MNRSSLIFLENSKRNDGVKRLKKILLVEDDLNISRLTASYLNHHGYQVTCVYDGAHAHEIVISEPFDLVLLDVLLPNESGWDVCKYIQANLDVPIIMLTALGDVRDRVHGLSLGADDYLIKPFDPQELLARIQAILRREERAIGKQLTEHQTIQYGDLRIDCIARTVMLSGERIEMPRREFDLLQFLFFHPNQVFSRDTLIERILGFDFEGEDRVIDLYIKRIRQRLVAQAMQPWEIVTVRGVGYKFEVKHDNK
jgi:DNA-binding response OmpR family regulator